ncbi:hypothetical protein DOO78_26170 [Roseicella frigidaeris]|uniref:Uncharacterized protein n=2 Tax=Roseicella frigidaeris TaxID=2230885 RepID=A0A327LUW5_9PROT|nr:hypothetical protein DOO78_26170 [Roseicella frigidaeris]
MASESVADFAGIRMLWRADWPAGSALVYEGVEINPRHHLRQGCGEVTKAPLQVCILNKQHAQLRTGIWILDCLNSICQ